jgi:hypothetical protein
MTVADILSSVKFVVDPNGQQSAVLVGMDVWEEIISLLEIAEEIEHETNPRKQSP